MDAAAGKYGGHRGRSQPWFSKRHFTASFRLNLDIAQEHVVVPAAQAAAQGETGVAKRKPARGHASQGPCASISISRLRGNLLLTAALSSGPCASKSPSSGTAKRTTNQERHGEANLRGGGSNIPRTNIRPCLSPRNLVSKIHCKDLTACVRYLSNIPQADRAVRGSGPSRGRSRESPLQTREGAPDPLRRSFEGSQPEQIKRNLLPDPARSNIPPLSSPLPIHNTLLL